MNKIEKSENNNTQNMSSFKTEDIKRCLNCYKTLLIELIKKNDEYFIKYNCENGHKGEVSLEEYLKNDKYSFKKLNCGECNKKQENDFYLYNYCITCQKILCHNCLINHSVKQHQTNNFSKYDSICSIHNNTYDNYCNNCKKNICMLCLKEHNDHQIYSLSKYLSSENVENFDNKINEVKNEIEKIKKEIIEELSKELDLIKHIYLNYVKNMNMKFSLINNLIDTYNFEKKLNNYNYEIIENLKNIDKIKFEYPDFSNCKNIFEKYKNGVIQNLNSNKSQTLEKHTNIVNQIILLKDGRIASSSDDKSILIYNKEMDKDELTIKLDDKVLNIMQSNDGYIFASLESGSISIIKLNTLNSYQLIQSVKEHQESVNKIIQIKDGRFISCSNDKTIKIWEFSNEKLILNKTLNEDNEINSIIEYKENEIISTPYGNGSIIFWDINKPENKKSPPVECYGLWNNIQKINDHNVIIGGEKYIYLFQNVIIGGEKYIYLFQNYDLIKKIEINSGCYSICYLSNGNILTGHQNGNIKEWKFNNNELNCIGEKEGVYDDEINVIYEIKNKFILTGVLKSINIYKI